MNFQQFKDVIIRNNTISPNLYSEFDVKRGLRNADGSGVLAGLSLVSSVIGVKKDADGNSVDVDGVFKIRGHNIFDLMDLFQPGSRFCFERMVYLLLIGELPSEEELTDFSSLMASKRALPKAVVDHVIHGLPSKDIMNKIQTSLAALYGFDDTADTIDPLENLEKAVGIIAKFPAIVAYSYLAAYKPDAAFVEAPAELSHAESLLYMLKEGQMPTETEAYILDLALVLHAEHGGGNNSSFATYVVSSSNSDIYSTLAAAVASLKGPLHGAANSKVMKMMDDVKAHMTDLTSQDELKAYITKILKKEAYDKTGKIYGLGHAVYTKSDPRAIALMKHAVKLAKEKNREDELQLYFNLEKLGPQLFSEIKGSDKVIAPNVDFFSGFVYDCMGIPQAIYTPLFATARSAGWCAHRIEELINGGRIIRPAYKYVGK